ncbi:MAG: class II aldolase/adducin family protein [Rhodobacter sp.]|nr:class II aldolase/adducin family protein [Rhodobacter sp.]
MSASGGPVAPELVADLAAAARILAARGVVDGFGHVSMRHPGAPDRYLMSRALAPALVVPADIVEYDLNSVPCDPDAPKGFLERFIHGEIYRARPDLNAVVHSHSPSVIPFGLTDTPMQACFHNAAFLARGAPVFNIQDRFGDTDMLVSDGEKGVALADCLGDHDIALMRAHGSVACGPTLQSAVFRAVYTEVNARVQHWTHALANGGPIAALSPEEGRLADQPNQTAGLRAWDLWRREIRKDTGW